MELVQQSWRYVSATVPYDGTDESLQGRKIGDVVKLIESVGRICYKTEDRITEESADKFVKMLLDRGHHAMIEHAFIGAKMITDRGVTHEIVRHRISSYAQESTRYCVDGNTLLSPKNFHWSPLTVKEMFQKKLHSGGKWKRLKVKSLDLQTGELVFTPILDIFNTGIKKTIEITTYLGYKLILTPDHRILTEDGFMEAESCLGKMIAVNGKCIAEGGIDALRKYHWNKGRVDIPRKDRVIARTKFTCHKLVEEQCEICEAKKSDAKLYVHHIDENRNNNSISNLVTVCNPCHSRVHSKNLEFVHYDQVMSIKEVGKREVYDLVMPNRNFVANGVVVHNCNYGKLGVRFIIPTDFTLDDEDLRFLESCEAQYNRCLAMGRIPGQARYFLPNGLKTEIAMSCNVREWLHFFSLRADPAAHAQMRALASSMLVDFAQKLPVLFKGMADKKGV